MVIFSESFTPEPNSGCWLWDRPLRKDGYAQVEIRRGRAKLAHRLSWEIHRGPIPEKLKVCHKCDVRCCVNPDHLFLGTQMDNVRDMWAKGRGVAHRGEAHPQVKLTREQVEHIRRKEMRGVDYAALYGVTRQAVYRVQKGLCWVASCQM